ncbi:hypothetical protein BH11PLA1_BH11PLA1_16010 [soil metagenome]
MNRASFNNLVAGGFLLAFLILAVGTTLVLAGFREGLVQRTNYIVRFTLADGAEGLDVGSNVKVGGRKSGKVKALEFVRDPQTDVISGVDVTVAIDKEIKLYRNARVYLQLPLLGSQSQINIPSTGNPATLTLASGENAVVEAGERIAGRLAPPAFLSQAGYGEEQADQVRLILNKGAAVATRLERVAASAESQLDKAMPAAAEVVADIRAMTGDFRKSVSKLTPALDTIIANVTEAVAMLSGGVADAKAVIGSVKKSVDVVLPRVEKISGDVAEVTERAKTAILSQVEETLAAGKKAVEDFGAVGAKFRALVDELTPDVRTTMANLRLGSDQMKLALIEVRRNPWRVLYQPSKKEFQEEVLFDAARTYASAVSNLRAASEALEQSLAGARGSGQPLPTEAIKAIQDRIDAAFAEYRAAEKKFLERFMGEGSGSR